MTAEAITGLPAARMAQLIVAGELSSAEVVEAHIARIEAVDPVLNAVVVRRYEAARAEARAADALRARGGTLPPLHGVPVSVKEALDLAGLPSTFGLPSRASHRAPADEPHVARLRAAGAIVLAKTNVSQCLAYSEADNPLYGCTRNPWNPARSSGGSSGGEGALIAAGGSPLGLGTDIGGSVRVPAAYCGIAALKPTAGRMDDMGECSWPAGQRAIASQVGVLARTAEDVALGLDLAQDRSGGLRPLQDWRTVNLRGLKVACYLDDGSLAPAPALQRAVREAAAYLQDAGAEVVAWTPPEVPAALALFNGLMTADGGSHLRQLLRGNAVTAQLRQMLIGAGLPPWLLPPVRRLLRALGQDAAARSLEGLGGRGADAYFRRVQQQHRYRQAFSDALGDCELILGPAGALPAVTHGASGELLTAGAYAPLYNLLGWPAGVTPVSRVRAAEESQRPRSRDRVERRARQVELGSAGLPVGVQLAARPWQEHRVLAAMHAIEQAARTRPDFPRTPVMPSPAQQSRDA